MACAVRNCRQVGPDRRAAERQVVLTRRMIAVSASRLAAEAPIRGRDPLPGTLRPWPVAHSEPTV
jgi:hypothetical protein